MLFPLIKPFSVFQHYYNNIFMLITPLEFVVLLSYGTHFVVLSSVHAGLFPKIHLNCVLNFELLPAF